MYHAVEFLPDPQMPAGHDWIYLEVDGSPHLLIRESRGHAGAAAALLALVERVELVNV